MLQRLTLDQLIIDDSFINFCYRANPEDILKWEEYLTELPEEAGNVEQARTLVLALRIMLKDQRAQAVENNTQNLLLPVEANGDNEAKIIRLPLSRNIRRYRIAAIAAAVVLAIIVSGSLLFHTKKDPLPEGLVTSKPQATTRPVIFRTGLGEKRLIYLPDSTKVYLNAGSALIVSADFGDENRVVTLKGEALFDVTHNKALPFLVHTDNYYVRVLGTVFNVNAYPGDKISETSLITGKVEIFMQKDSSDYLYKVLKPKEKFVMNIRKDSLTNNSGSSGRSVVTTITGLSYTGEDENIETAWTKNRLIIENEKFAGLKEKLERWYNVQLVFENENAKDYRFTASFEKENIEQVMRALKASYPFDYRMEGNKIIIEKSKNQ